MLKSERYQRQVSFGDAVLSAFSNYCCFYGRASRSEYWWFQLFLFIVNFLLGCFSFTNLFFFGFFTLMFSFSFIWSLIVLLPQLGLAVRRLHDIGKSGFNLFWGLVPIAGPIIILVFFCTESQMFPNQYGPIPNMTDIPNNNQSI